MITTIIFDAFDTLFQVKSGASAKYIINRIAESGHDVDNAEFLSLWKEYYKEKTAEDAVFKTEREIFISRIQMFYDKYGVSGDAAEDADNLLLQATERPLFYDTRQTLSYLKDKYNVYIGSNTDNDVLSAVISKNGVTFDKVYTSENLRSYKPSKRFYEAIVNDNDLSNDEILFVGDSIIDDIFGPQKLNIKTCWLNRKGKPRTTITPDYEIQSLTELIQILK